MPDLPKFLKQGEAARLFPVLATTSKEGRATSILLSCMAKVDEFSANLLATLGVRAGKRTKVECFTEVVFKETSEKNKRPDGLLVVNTGAQQKHFLIEAKIGAADLDPVQIESYLKICKEHKLDGVITISNLYSTRPDFHPMEEVRKLKIKVPVFHWSWMSVLTTIDLMLSNEEVADTEQKILMNELRRFLSHESTGVRGFERMPPEWAEVNKIFSNQGSINPKSDLAAKVVLAWQQEAKDLCLVLSRKTNTYVKEKISNAWAKQPDIRTKNEIKTLIDKHILNISFDIPDAAAPIELIADLGSRTIYVGMTINAPGDRVSSKARLNWLLRQLKTIDNENVFIRTNWPGSSSPTVHSLNDLIKNPDLISDGKEHLVAASFVVFLSKRTGPRFAQMANFVSDLEEVVPSFYGEVGQNLFQWKKPAPRINTTEGTLEGVAVSDIAKDAETFE